jgi:YD repeat-containing protein
MADHNKKLLNGRGQVRQEQAEGAGGVWDLVDTVYNNLGQTVQQSRPYRAGQGPVWTNVEYDALGRTKKVIAPDGTQDGSATEYFYNEISRPDIANQSAPGQTTRVKDAWGRERWGRTDAQGRLAEVVEPDPNGNGAVATNGLATTYDYDAPGRLTQTNQGAQTRKFKYDSLGRLTRQKLAEAAATLNDAGDYVGAAAGLWSDAFAYDLRSNLVWRRDARGVKTAFDYGGDPLNRLQSVTYDTTQDPNHNLPANDPNYYLRVLDVATVTYAYRTRQNANDLLDVTDVLTVTTAGVGTESYAYDAENRVASMTTALNSRSGSLTTGYLYDPLDRVTNVYYPNKVWTATGADKVAHHDYDTASRLSKLQVSGVDFAANIAYNAASQTTSLTVGKPGGQQFTESYGYHAQTGLLENQQVTRLSDNANLLNLNYNYANAAQGNHVTGQLVNTTDNRDATGNHNRSYVYDALGRLTQAKGGPATPLWTQSYGYDRYGNRTTVRATGNAAGTPAPACSPTQTKDAEQFVKDFYQRTLQRQPTSAELNSWTNQLRQSYWQGANALNQTVAYLGRTLFKSTEYINLGRTDTQFVTDLYWAFLQRAPDTPGLNWWVSQVPGAGRDAVREAFAHDPGETAARNGEMCPRTSGASGPIPTDGLASLTFNAASNRITTSGFQYDAAGNQTQTVRVDGSYQRFQYDAANRLVKVFDGNGYTLQTVTYGATNQRLAVQDGDANSNDRSYYAAAGGTVLAEYVETPATPRRVGVRVIFCNCLGGRLERKRPRLQ